MIGVLVSGTGTNLQALLDAGLPVSAVASNTAGVQALERAEQVSVPTAVFREDDYADRADRDEAMADWLDDQRVELVVCAGYMQLLSPGFLVRFRCINVHPSLLPAFPGLDAVGQALAAGAEETGVTVHFLDEGVDTGPVIAQERVRVEVGDTSESLLERVHDVEHRLLPRVVRDLLPSAQAVGGAR